MALVAVGPLGAQDREAAPPAKREADPPASADQDEPKPANYGRTPDTAIPYRNFRQPYLRFFQKPVEFLGTGRYDEAGAASSAVRIGFFGPVESAPDADLGEEMLEGVRLAIEQANDAGGYQGVPFDLVIRKDLGLWGASSNEMVAFKYEDDVLAVIGSIDGANTHIALRVALKTQMPMVNTATTDPTLTETNIPWLLRCMADDRQQGYALAYHIFQQCGIKKVAAFRVNDRYGRTGIGEFRDAARRLKRPLRAELRWDRGERDFTVQLDRIAEIDPEAIVIWGNAADAAAVVKEIRRRKMPVRIFGSDRLASASFLDAAAQAAEGVVAAASHNPDRDDPSLRAFESAYSDRFGHMPGTFAAHAYDGTNILIAAIRKAGPNRVRIRDALYECAEYQGVTGPIIFDTTLNDIGPVYLAKVQDGRFFYQQVDFAPGPGSGAGGGAATSLLDGDADHGAGSQAVPYRTLAQSPPVARSPDRPAGEPGAVLRIGCFLPLEEAGEAAVRGMRSAIAEDARHHPGSPPIELLVRDARGLWSDNTTNLVDLVHAEGIVALIGSTERRGTHLAEMLAAKMHFPVVALCGTDPTITQIPLPWVFSVAPVDWRAADEAADPEQTSQAPENTGFALGYDAVALVAARIRAGARSRRTLRDGLARGGWHAGQTGVFRFDALGRRIDREPPRPARMRGRPDRVPSMSLAGREI